MVGRLKVWGMAGIDENIVREYFELGGFLVRQLQKYQVQSRKKRAEEEIDIVTENPLAREGDLSFIITDEDLPKIRRAAIAVRGWHTTTFSAATLNSSGQIFNFLHKSALKRLDSIFGEGHKICKILVLPGLPKGRAERQKSVSLLKSKGVDGVLTYPNMLQSIIDKIEPNNNYQKSDLIQTLRILKNYGMLKDPQMDLFAKSRNF